MTATIEKLDPEIGETERFIEEFKQQVIQSLERERSRLRDIAEKDAKGILTRAYQESANVTSKCQEESKRLLESSRIRAKQEGDEILSLAHKKAEQIVNDAEDICKREAKDKTRREVENLLRSAREDSGKVASKALQEAKEQANSMLSEARKQAAIITKTATEEAEQTTARIAREANDLKQKATSTLAEAQKKAEEAKTQLIEAARKSAVEKAEKEAAEIIARANAQGEKERKILVANALVEAKHNADLEAARMLNKSKQEADDLLQNAKNKVNGRLEESTRLMLEIQQKMHQVIGTAGLDIKVPEQRSEVQLSNSPNPTPGAIARPPKDAPVVPRAPHNDEKEARSVSPVQENSSTYDDIDKTYQGRLKIDIAPPADADQVTQLEQHLLKTPNVKVLGKGGAEDGSAWVDLEAVKPVPLVEILRKVPAVKDVVGAKSYIIVALKAKQLV